MGRFASTYAPKSATGGISDNQQALNLAAGSASSNITVGKRQTIVISVVPGSTSGATIGATVRFSLGGSAATSGDFCIPLNTTPSFELGDEYDTVSFFNPNAAGSLTISVMRLTV